jgi:hypothetical protein
MRRELIEATSEDEARDKAPWAATIVKVEGGYMAFESMADYETWRKQV